MVLDLLATWIPALLIALSGVMKLTGNVQILETMRAFGVGRYVRWLGVMEVAFATLFVIPRRSRWGFCWHRAISGAPSPQSCRMTR
jgi:hypothetical protein